MIEAAERSGLPTADSVLVESSSGNLGVALSTIAASKGYRFVCVTDSRRNLATRQMMEALGTDVRIITEPHPEEGYLERGSPTSGSCARATTGTMRLNQYVEHQQLARTTG